MTDALTPEGRARIKEIAAAAAAELPKATGRDAERCARCNFMRCNHRYAQLFGHCAGEFVERADG